MDTLGSVEAIKEAIRGGELGAEIAEKAVSEEGLSLTEVHAEDVPYRIYTFFLSYTGYAVVVDSDELVLLGEAPGHFRLSDVALQEEGDLEVLSYYFCGGFGAEVWCRGRYVMGSMEAVAWREDPPPTEFESTYEPDTSAR